MAKDKAAEKAKEDKPAETPSESSSDAAENTAQLGDAAGGKGAKKERPPVDPGKMHIKVYSPYQVYFDNQGESISAINDTGPFDILPQHHRFLTLLSPCELLIKSDKGEEKIKISRGIMYVKEDRVTVFLDV